MSDSASTIHATSSNTIPNQEFRGTVGGDWLVVATVDPSLLSTPQEPIISQEDEDEIIQICFKNFSGILTMTKGICGEMLLSLDAEHSVPSKEWWPASMAPSISDDRYPSPTPASPKVVRMDLSLKPKLPSPTRGSPKPVLPSPSILKRKKIESSRQDEGKVGEEQKPEDSLAASGTQNSMKARPAASDFLRSVSWKAPTNMAIISETETTTTLQPEQKPLSPPPPPPPPPPLLDPGDMADDIDNSAHLEQPAGSLRNKPSTLMTTTKSIGELYEYNTGPKSARVATGSEDSTWEPSIELTQSSRDDSGYDEYDNINSLSGRPPPPPPFTVGGSPGRTTHPKKHWNDYSFRPQDLAKDAKSSEFRRKSGMDTSSTYGDWDPDESDYASPLHEACDSPFATTGELEDALTDCPKAVSKIDDQGRLPLHILANNRELIVAGGDAGREIATSFAKQLIRAYPESVLIQDNDGRLPFTGQIVRWIEWTYSKQDEKEKPGNPVRQLSVSRRGFVSRFIPAPFRSIITRSSSSRAISTNSSVRGLSTNSEIENTNLPTLNRAVSTPIDGSTKRFPPAEMTEEVEWCFDMLSLALDLSGGRTASGVSRPQLSYKNQLMNRETIARNVGSIPLLLKTILLLEANDERARILQSSIVRRALLSPESVGSWLTSMLRYRPIPSRLAVDYFEVISNLSVQDFIGHFRKPSPGDMLEFRAAREIMFEEIFELGGTIPSLVVLDEKEIERAASTRAVYFVMSKSLTQPLVVALVVTDFVMQITLMLAFRSAVVTPDIAILTADLPIPANFVIITLCAYLLFRVIVDIVALAGVSKKVLYRHLYDPWNIVDVVCICLTLTLSIFIHLEGVNERRGLLHAITLGLLWIRLLNFLKVVNERTAMFILALVQILRDARYFLVVFTAVIFLFSDMLYVIFHSDREKLCVGDDIPPSSLDYCSDRPYNAYIRTYAIILGDIQVEDYRAAPAVTVIFCLITFFAFIILLNVLIAVLSASYDQARRKSASLFRRARIEFVASHTALEKFVRPPKKGSSLKIRSRVHHVMGLLILLSMLGTTIVAEIYLVGAAWAVKTADNATLIIVMYGFLSVVLSLGIWGVAFFTFGAFVRDLLPSYAARGVEIADSWLQSLSRYAAVKLFGLSDPCGGIDALFDSEDELNHIGDADEIAQLRWIRKELHTTERHLKQSVQTSEERLRRQFVLATDPANVPVASQVSSRNDSLLRKSAVARGPNARQSVFWK